jgi:adenylate cyclase
MVEDYFGDGMMACYGIPIPSRTPEEIRRDADNAVESALAMQRTLNERNADRGAEGLPPVSIRVGISTGVVVAGSMGSSNRLKYAVVGDSVVTAQRLESIGLDRVQHDFDESPARILISESTFTLIDPAFQIEPVGSFLVKGKTQPVEVHRVIGRSEPRRAEAEEDLA